MLGGVNKKIALDLWAVHLIRSSTARVCIVTPELAGPSKSSGVGTAYSSLAQVLAAGGHDVTILYAGTCESELNSIERWQEAYHQKRVSLIALDHSPIVAHSAPHIRDSYDAFLWLRNNGRFDVIHFSDDPGLGFYSVLAKHQGIAFHNSTLCVGTHGSTSWEMIGNGARLEGDLLEIDFLEHESVRFADVIVSPSRFMVNWLRTQNWKLPDRVVVRPNAFLPQLFEDRKDIDQPARPEKQGAVSELVFLGRLDRQKGLELFCDSIDLLVRRGHRDCQITFLGKPSSVDRRGSVEYVDARASKWPLRIRIIPDKDRDDALRYLTQRTNVLAVIPSLSDNSPYTVLEALNLQIPFVASAVGGIPELIAERDCGRVCFFPRAENLALRLDEALGRNPKIATPAFDYRANNQAWVQWHSELATKSSGHTDGPEDQKPLVTVCLYYSRRSGSLNTAIESLRNQTYSRLEVILVYDRKVDRERLHILRNLEPIFLRYGWRIIPMESISPGVGYNAAAAAARGEYAMFMNIEDYAHPNEIGTLVRVARKTSADAVTCLSLPFSGEELAGFQQIHGRDGQARLALRHLAVPDVRAALVGETNFLIRRDVFARLGGFKNKRGRNSKQLQFANPASIEGLNVECVPLPLYWHRARDDASVAQKARAVRNIKGILLSARRRLGALKSIKPR